MIPSSWPRPSIFQDLGVRPVINACGIYTDLGGSLLSPEIMAACSELNQSWIRMTELLDRTGELIAGWLDVPAARVTPGASAAIALGVGACLVGRDPANWSHLPDTSGLKNEVLLQARHLEQYKYAVCARLAGATLKTAGNSRGTTADELNMAIDSRCAAIFVPAHLEDAATVPLETVAQIARAHGIPVIVDAAYLNFPLVPDASAKDFTGVAKDMMSSFHRRGADLVCFSAKYFWGPNAGGFICGRKDLVDVVAGLDFTRFESGPHKTFGRTFKMNRFDVAATALALRSWLTLDHAGRLAAYSRQVTRLAAMLRDVPGIKTRPAYFTLDEKLVPSPVNCLVVEFGPDAARSVSEVEALLAQRDPRILACVENGALVFVMESVREGDETIIGGSLCEVMKVHA